MSEMALSSPTVVIIKKGQFSDDELAKLHNSNANIEILEESEYEARVDRINREAFAPYRKELSGLSFEGKLEWYSKRNSQEIVYLGNNPYFQKYWKWRVLMPMKMRRFYYRLKNGELWKRYAHITDTPDLRQNKKEKPTLEN